jgi:hypothetical protein
LVSHTVCPEHGDIVHGDSHHQPAITGDGRDAAGPSGVDAGERGNEGHGHDHCTLPSHRTDASLVARLLTTIVEPPSLEHSSEVAAPHARESFALPRPIRLLFAPKSSPPVAG